jgi:hypothetical protein
MPSPWARSNCRICAFAESRLDLRLDHRRTGELLVANAIVGLRGDRAGCLADPHQQLDRHARPLGKMTKGDAAERREPLERGGVEEVERYLAVADDGPEALQRDSGRGETLDERGAAQMSLREPAVGAWREDAQLDEPLQLIDADSGPLSRLCRVVRLHRRTVRGAIAADMPCQSRPQAEMPGRAASAAKVRDPQRVAGHVVDEWRTGHGNRPEGLVRLKVDLDHVLGGRQPCAAVRERDGPHARVVQRRDRPIFKR